MKRGLNWAYFMFKNHFRKYFRYAQMTSFIFETIIEFSAAIRNVYAQLVLMNRGLTSTYIMLIWMLLWHPLTYLFPRGECRIHPNVTISTSTLQTSLSRIAFCNIPSPAYEVLFLKFTVRQSKFQTCTMLLSLVIDIDNKYNNELWNYFI